MGWRGRLLHLRPLQTLLLVLAAGAGAPTVPACWHWFQGGCPRSAQAVDRCLTCELQASYLAVNLAGAWPRFTRGVDRDICALWDPLPGTSVYVPVGVSQRPGLWRGLLSLGLPLPWLLAGIPRHCPTGLRGQWSWWARS